MGPRRVLLAALAAFATVAPGSTPAAAQRPSELPLGPRSLDERRSSRAVAQGVLLTRISRGRPTRSPATGPWVVNVLTVDRSRIGGRLSAVLSNDRVAGVERPSAMARRTRALAGVNGSFYVGAGPGIGDLVGALALGGDLVSESTDGRTSLLLPQSRSTAASIAPLSFAGRAEVGGRSRLVDGVDRPAGRIPQCGGRGGDRPTERSLAGTVCTDASEMVAFTPRFGPATPRAPNATEAVARDGQVLTTTRGGGTPIPADGYVLSGTGDAAALLDAAEPGTRSALTTSLLRGGARLSLDAYEAVVSGGPGLISSGRVRIRSAAEGFTRNRPFFRSFVAARNPRTLVGVRADGGVLLVTVDGRRPRHSVGVSLPEAARLMRALGAREALNLDGGGSTAMTVGGRVVNRPSDPAGERPVGDGIFVLP